MVQNNVYSVGNMINESPWITVNVCYPNGSRIIQDRGHKVGEGQYRYVLTPGTYYLKFYAYSCVQYAFQLTAQTPTLSYPNDKGTLASPYQLKIGTEVVGLFAHTDGEDVMKFTLSQLLLPLQQKMEVIRK